MEKQNMIDILKRINNLLDNDDIFNTKEYIKLEIDNLIGRTPFKCKKNGKYSSYFCKDCYNINCPDNKR